MSKQHEPKHIPHLDKSRHIIQRIVVTGNLTLQTPAHFGNGDTDGVTDLSLLRDPLEGKALLTGATIAGALRNYLWEREFGYRCRYNMENKRHNQALAIALFGGVQSDPDGRQSALIVDDALGKYPTTELRDGVRIDPKRRTAADDMKYDIELLRAGSTFPLHFELLIGKDQNSDKLKQALAIALSGLEQAGEICLGSRKRRGFGECMVSEWSVTNYDLTTGEGLLDWLDNTGVPQKGSRIGDLLELNSPTENLHDHRHLFQLQADFWLDGSLLVRSGIGEEIRSDSDDIVNGPDAMHIHRLQKSGVRTPVLPGTSVAGALRHRALRIAQLFHAAKGIELVNSLFGSDPEHKQNNGDTSSLSSTENDEDTAKAAYTGSKISVRETIIKNAHTLIQHRIRIDRFTGGVLDNYLFDEAPLFGGADSIVQLDLTVRNPTDQEVGLLLLLLKDLWTADLALGGGVNVGRGRLRGLRANCVLHKPPKAGERAIQETWQIQQRWSGRQADQLQVIPEAQAQLEKFVKALQKPISDSMSLATAAEIKGEEAIHA